MKVVYNGVHPEVVVDEFDPEHVIAAGEPVDLPDDLAARLLEQDTWQPADKAAQTVQANIDQAQAEQVPAPDPQPTPAAPAGSADSPAPADASASAATSTEGNS